MPRIDPIPLPPFLLGTGVITGRVLCPEDWDLVAGARVEIRPVNPVQGTQIPYSWVPVFETEANGSFRIEGLKPGRYLLDVHKDGCLRLLATTCIGLWMKGESFAADDIARGHWNPEWDGTIGAWPITRAGCPKLAEGEVLDVELMLKRGRPFHGVVRDGAGRALPGVRIQLEQHWDGPDLDQRGWSQCSVPLDYPATTDEAGAFKTWVAPIGKVIVSVESPGLIRVSREIDVLGFENPLELTLVEGATLRGRITHPDGTVAPWVPLRVIHPTDGSVPVLLQSDAQGHFEASGLAPAPRYVMAQADNGSAALLRIESYESELQVRLDPRFKIVGRVVDAQGHPLEGLMVAHRPQAQLEGSLKDLEVPGGLLISRFMTRTDAEGRFDVDACLPVDGKVMLRLFHMNEETRVARHMEAWVAVDRIAEVVFTPTSPLEEGPRAESSLAPAPAPPMGVEERNRRWIEWLKGSPGPAAVELMAQLRDEFLKDGGSIGPRPDLLPVFEAALRHPDSNVGFWAISAIAYMKSELARPYLVRAMVHSDIGIRDYAIMGLKWLLKQGGSLNDDETAALGKIFEGDTSERVRLEAGLALIEGGRPVDPEPFYRSLRSTDMPLIQAARALAQLGRKDAIEGIILRFGEDPTTDRELMGALQVLTGATGLHSAKAWLAWLEANRSQLPEQRK